MDAVFNIKRFGDLMKKEIAYSWKTYSYILLGMIAYYIIAKLIDTIWQINLIVVFPALVILLMVCVIPVIDRNMNKANFIPFLTSPVSTFERWTMLWAKSVLIMPILIIATLLLLDEVSPMLPIDKLYKGKSTEQIVTVIHSFLAFQSIFFFGYIYFKKRAVIKTILAITAFALLASLISNIILSSRLYPEIAGDTLLKNSINLIEILEFNGFYRSVSGNHIFVSTGTTAVYDACLWVFRLIFPFGLWVLSYIRLREREI
ncbi:MAG: hypothetical protein LBL79_11015 [Prevotella sp.]|jgi:hypothetical protein|nr:hypothetical protein [Prevotella sp.]